MTERAYLFLGSKFVALHVKYAMDPSRNNKTALIAKFWMGSQLRRLKILKPNLTTHVAFTLTNEYVFIEKL